MDHHTTSEAALASGHHGTVSFATLDAACERIRTLEADMRRIRDLCKPGQRLGIGDAIDIICDVYTFANESIR